MMYKDKIQSFISGQEAIRTTLFANIHLHNCPMQWSIAMLPLMSARSAATCIRHYMQLPHGGGDYLVDAFCNISHL